MAAATKVGVAGGQTSAGTKNDEIDSTPSSPATDLFLFAVAIAAPA